MILSHRKFTILSFLLLAVGSCLTSADGQAPPPGGAASVRKTLEDFTGAAWAKEQFSKARGTVTADAGKAPDVPTERSLKAAVDFAGKGDFEFFTAAPSRPLYIPGDARKVTMRIKRSGNHPLRVTFVDGWGRRAVGGKDYAWDPKLGSGTDWQTVTFEVPAEWPRPVGIAGFSTFDRSNQPELYTFWIDDIEAETDLSAVDPVSGLLKTWIPDPAPADKEKALRQPPATPLLSVLLSTPAEANVFSDTDPAVTLQIRNWNAGAVTGKAVFTLSDAAGAKLKTWEQELKVESTQSYSYPVELRQFGLYHLSVNISLTSGASMEKQISLAKVPVLPEPTEAQKRISPYGLNYHGGGTRLFDAFKKAGFYWYRDYAWRLSQMQQAKGADGRYAGWPFYPTVLDDYEKRGLIVVPILGAIFPPVFKDGRMQNVGPDEAWTRQVAQILLAFPSIKYWELDNEYELKRVNHQPEREVKWENYRLYHQKFAELADILGDGSLMTIENGRSGIYPVFEEECVKSGAFEKIGALNSHHYTGTEPPETNSNNFNSGSRLAEGQRPGSFFDALRAVKRAAVLDGKNREAWLTEFGWDTLAGPIVTPEQQAAYLQRGFLLAFAAGNEKAFWFYNFDEAKGVQFFDGCGLITHDHQPKLSFAAMAGLSAILPFPRYVGSINAGANTGGYVFENEGRLVAGLWAITGDAGPKVTFSSGQLKDYMGNTLEGLSTTLRMAPVYNVDLSKTDPFYLQTAYDLDSDHLIVVTAGDAAEATLGITNNRDREIQAQIATVVPKGWTADAKGEAVTVAPGGKQKVRLPFTVGLDEKLGRKEVQFVISEGGKAVKTVPLTVLVQPPFHLEVAGPAGAPGKAAVDVTVENRSTSPQGGKLSLRLPQSWQALTPEMAVEGLKPGEKRSIKLDLVWTPDWKDGESAMVRFVSDKAPPVEAAIIPREFHVFKASGLKLDGEIKDWPARQEVPSWLLGSTLGGANARLWLAWAPDGLYGAVEVHDSKAQVQDPQHFWGGDVLELFLSTGRTPGSGGVGPGDHQFWLVPDFKAGRVYVGQWKVKSEIEATRYDVPGIRSAARRTPDGYVMEFFLPATAFQKFEIAPGGYLGLNANLTIRGAEFDREVYWPRAKAAGLGNPQDWGKLKIEE